MDTVDKDKLADEEVAAKQAAATQLPVPLNIFQRLNAVRARVHYVRKEARVGEGGYLAVTHDAVTALIREHLVREGVLVVPSIMKSATVLTGTTTAKGIPFVRYEATYRFTVVNVDDPKQAVVFDLEAHAIDQGDKAPGKAISYATKYAYLKLLTIESGEEEEEREPQKPAITPASGAKDRVSPERLEEVEDLGSEILDLLNADMIDKAARKFYDAQIDTDERVYLWTFFTSKQKTAMKKSNDAHKAATGK